MARKFLYVIAALIVLVIAAAFAYRLFGTQLIRLALVPREQFQSAPQLDPATYRDARMWVARPDIADNPSLWTPAGYHPAPHPPAAVFFVHPTSYLARGHWNAPLAGDPETNARTAIFLRGQASAFNEVGQVWSPRYRQATFGAFLTDRPDAQRALDLAYHDVDAAFTAFLAQIGPDRPIVLAGHSQGALHLERLIKERVAGKPLARRIVAAYVVGWPISRTADLPALGLPACTAPGQPGCILSWLSFAEPADPSLFIDTFDATTGLTGRARRGSEALCVNPLTGTPGSAAPASANLGTLFPSQDLGSAAIVPGRVPARCGPRGLLLIGEGPNVGPYVLPGNNYHVYDYSLFWANVRADVARRLAAWQARR